MDSAWPRSRGATGEGSNVSGTAAFQRANGRRGNRSPARTSRLDPVASTKWLQRCYHSGKQGTRITPIAPRLWTDPTQNGFVKFLFSVLEKF